MINADQTLSVLRPWLGCAFIVSHVPLIEKITVRLNTFDLRRDNFTEIAQWMDSLLFMQVREDTKGKMVLSMDDGHCYRVRVEDFKDMADELLYLLFQHLPQTADAFIAVREYSLRDGSLSALRALYLDFTNFQTVEEWETVRRVITTCYPSYRWRSWIDGKRGALWEKS